MKKDDDSFGGKPESTYEVYALRYGRLENRYRYQNVFSGDIHDDSLMPMDYYLWVIRNADTVILVDTGFSDVAADKRRREKIAEPAALLAKLGIVPDNIREVVITHMHYDHAGNLAHYPNARFHVQDREMAYCTGRHMCHGMLSRPFEAEDVAQAVKKLFAGRLVFHDGDDDIAPGVSVHLIGGHTDGMQVVSVLTERGRIVLASDAMHFWENFDAQRPFTDVFHIGDLLAGYTKLKSLAESNLHIVPGHDPKVREVFQALPDEPNISILHRLS